MKKAVVKIVRRALQQRGLDLARYSPAQAAQQAAAKADDLPFYFDSLHRRVLDSVRECTMTGPERIHALIEAVKYVVRSGIEGAMVECGVWKGGSVMAMAMALIELEDQGRDLYLFDTFAGMTRPTEEDQSFKGQNAPEIFAQKQTGENASDWCASPLEEVKSNVLSTHYSADRFHFVQGSVEETLPAAAPERIALLRLDTDWYASTKHELEHLFPRLAPGGVLIIDDYGHWHGCGKAVDEYIAENKLQILLHRVDGSCRVAVKQGI